MINHGLAKEDNSSQSKLSKRVIVLIGAVVVLVMGVVVFDRTRSASLHAQQSLATIENMRLEALEREKLSQRNNVLLQSTKSLVAKANSIAVTPSAWAERQINMRQQNLSRDLVNPLLLSSARNKNQLMYIEEFDLAVTQAEEGLFDLTINAQMPLILSFRGSLYFRLSERPL